MLVFYCEYKKQGRVARKITKIGRNPAEQKRCLLQSNNWPLFLREERFCAINYRGHRGILCTRGEKEHTSNRVSIIVCDNVVSKAKCATRTRLCRRTLRCTLHYASKLARSRCKANALFSAKKNNCLAILKFKEIFDYFGNVLLKNTIFADIIILSIWKEGKNE